MNKFKSCLSLMAVLSVMSFGVPQANAAFQSVGPLSPVHGMPLWYQDVSGLALKLCLDQTGLCPLMPPPFDVLPPPNGLGPVVTTVAPITALNFPSEVFYWFARVVQDIPVTGGFTQGVADPAPAKFVLTMAIEANPLFVPPQTFMRINLQKMVGGFVPASAYTVTTPFGSINFTSDPVDVANGIGGGTGGVGGVFAGQTFRNDVISLAPFTSLLPGIFPAVAPNQPAPITMDNYLVWDTGAPFGFVGDARIPHNAILAGTAVPAVVTVAGPGIAAGAGTITQFTIGGQMVGLLLTPPVLPPAVPNAGVIKAGITGVGSTSAPMTFTVRNLTALPIVPGFAFAPTVAGARADFAAVPGVGCAPFIGGGTCTFTVVFTPLADGVQSAILTVSDSALAPTVPPVTANVSGTGDAVAPTVTLANPNLTTKLATPTISGTVADNHGVGGVQVSVDGAVVPAAATVNAVAGTWSFVLPALTETTTLTPISHTISVTANDSALPAPGNVTPAAVTGTIVVDTVPPVITLAAPVAGATKIKTPVLTFSVVDATAVTLTVKVDGGAPINPTPASGATLGPLADGPHTVLVEATDAAGNAAIAKSVALTVDTIVSPFTLTAVTTPTNVKSQTIQGTVEAGSTVSVKVNALPAAPATVTGTNWNFPIAALVDGVNTISVTATDALGNTIDALGKPAVLTPSINIIQHDGKIAGAASVTIADALKSLQFAAGFVTPTADEKFHADVAPLVNGIPTGDGKVNIGDVVLILRKAAGLPSFQ
jgi:hypothetical protein